MFLGEPSASRWEILPQVSHRQVDGADRTPHADITSAAILDLVERKAGVVVVMEGAERLMVLHLHPHLFRDLLYRKFAQFLNLIFLHHIPFPFFFLASAAIFFCPSSAASFCPPSSASFFFLPEPPLSPPFRAIPSLVPLPVKYSSVLV